MDRMSYVWSQMKSAWQGELWAQSAERRGHGGTEMHLLVNQ